MVSNSRPAASPFTFSSSSFRVRSLCFLASSSSWRLFSCFNLSSSAFCSAANFCSSLEGEQCSSRCALQKKTMKAVAETVLPGDAYSQLQSKPVSKWHCTIHQPIAAAKAFPLLSSSVFEIIVDSQPSIGKGICCFLDPFHIRFVKASSVHKNFALVKYQVHLSCVTIYFSGEGLSGNLELFLTNSPKNG